MGVEQVFSWKLTTLLQGFLLVHRTLITTEAWYECSIMQSTLTIFIDIGESCMPSQQLLKQSANGVITQKCPLFQQCYF